MSTGSSNAAKMKYAVNKKMPMVIQISIAFLLHLSSFGFYNLNVCYPLHLSSNATRSSARSARLSTLSNVQRFRERLVTPNPPKNARLNILKSVIQSTRMPATQSTLRNARMCLSAGKNRLKNATGSRSGNQRL